MPDGKHHELVDGQLVERSVSAASGIAAAKLGSQLVAFCEAQGLGWILSSACGYRCFSKYPNQVRRPSVSYISRDRLSADQASAGYVTIAPDLAVEVVSPRDLAYEVDTKVQEYLDAGVKLVWVVSPPTRTVRVYRGDGSSTGLREADELSGETVLPGFRCRVGELFPIFPAAAAKTV
jgi:Uma2 family endonuclease